MATAGEDRLREVRQMDVLRVARSGGTAPCAWTLQFKMTSRADGVRVPIRRSGHLTGTSRPRQALVLGRERAASRRPQRRARPPSITSVARRLPAVMGGPAALGELEQHD